MSGSNLRLFALDSSGVRSLSALIILKQLIEAANPDAPPKLCNYFNIIEGISTGR
jgi:patatin-like phospholipase/acyl hydrolase